MVALFQWLTTVRPNWSSAYTVGPGRLGDRPGEAVGVGEGAVADGQHDRVAAGAGGRQGAR